MDYSLGLDATNKKLLLARAGGGITTHTITASANGTTSPSGEVSVNNGDNQTFTITPNSGYYISSVTVDGASKGAVLTYTVSNVTANHTINAAFAQNSGVNDKDSDSGGGGGYSGTNSTMPSASNAPADVSSSQATDAARTAAEAAKAAGSGTASVRMKNVGNIPLAVLQAMAKVARMPVKFQSDSMSADGKSVYVRITLDPVKSQRD